MAIPDFQAFTLPLLQLAFDGEDHTLSEAKDTIAERFRLTDAEKQELLPSGRQGRFANRIAWAKVYLQLAGLLESAQRGHFRITDRGREVLEQQPSRIDIAFLMQFDEFRQFRQSGRRASEAELDPASGTITQATETPEELLDQSYQSVRGEVEAELLKRVKGSSPRFFENLVVELLLKMGYGRNRVEAGTAIGSVGDEGIDGVISEDRLGLDNIYVQAKRWDGTVGRPEVQKFVGALHGKRASKGVFITTGTFSSEATDYVSRIDPRVVLVGGRQLAEFMFDLDVGVSAKATYEVKRIDSDYFMED